MPQAFGYDVDFGAGEESTFGTGVVATKFVEIQDESMAMEQSAIPKNTLASAQQRYFVDSKKSVGGTVTFPAVYQGMELFLEYAAQGVPTSAQVGATLVWQHTFVLADDMKTGLSVYIDRDSSQSGTAWRYTGCQIASLTLTQDMEEHMMCALEFIGKDQVKTAAESVTYPTFQGVKWTQNTLVEVDDGSTQTTIKAELTEFKIENPLADDRYKLGDRTRVGLGRSDVRKVTGKIALKWDDIVPLDLYNDATEVKVTANWVGAVADVGNAENYKMSIICPKVVFSGTTPTAQDHGPITYELPFEAFVGDASEDEIIITVDNLLTSV